MSESKKKVSIIIPVYNSKERLRECLESVVAQDYPALEVVIVDDCSTDGSLEICREYEVNYEIVKVYTKENEGVSAARNFGLERATGEYIQFVDSDDRLYPGATRQLVEYIQFVDSDDRLYPGATRQLVEQMEQDKSDLVIGGYWNEKENREVVPQSGVYEYKGDFIKEFPKLFTGFFVHVPWNKLYRRNVMKDISFPRDLSKGEDLVFNLRIMSGDVRISTVPNVLYFYHNVSDTSLSFRFREDAMEIEERLYQEVMKFVKCAGLEDLTFLYSFYLTAVKNKCYALMGKSGYSKARCKQEMKRWCQMESIRELCGRKNCFGVKDRILLMLMQYRLVTLLVWYYEWAAKRGQG